jgi:hypothetical protein
VRPESDYGKDETLHKGYAHANYGLGYLAWRLRSCQDIERKVAVGWLGHDLRWSVLDSASRELFAAVGAFMLMAEHGEDVPAWVFKTEAYRFGWRAVKSRRVIRRIDEFPCTYEVLDFNRQALARSFQDIEGLYAEGLFVLPSLSSLLAAYLQLILPPLNRRPEHGGQLVADLYALARRFSPDGFLRPSAREDVANDD